MPNHVFISDQEGTLLWEGESTAPFLGLQGGESFWFGTLEDRVWASVISITYGLDTRKGELYVEMIVQRTAPTTSRLARQNWTTVDHGDHRVGEGYGGMVSLEDGRLVVTVGASKLTKSVKSLTIQLNSPEGPAIKTETNVLVGSVVRLEVAECLVIVTLVTAHPRGRVRITEHTRVKGAAE